MVIGPQEVVRSEVEGGLSGPANSVPQESIDCGCAQMRCPKLARFATRCLFVALVSGVGAMQAAGQAYLLATSSTIARRFQFNPLIIDWIVCVSELTPILFGLLVAYWGDRIHRAAWTGSLIMVQGVCYISMIIPHFTSNTKIIEETENSTHMSLYGDDSPDFCFPGLSKVILMVEDSSVSTLVLLIIVQIFAGIGNIAFYSLTLSYVDDNTRKKNVAFQIAHILSAKCFGILLGYKLAWVFLKMDADNLQPVETYQEQIGAWWLAWPFLGLKLIIFGILLAIFPRRLPSEVVEQAAASILDNANESRRSSFDSYDQKYGSTQFLPSLLRILANKLVLFNVVAAMLALTAAIHFTNNGNIFLESRYYIPRPVGRYLGFGDPWTSRLVTTILAPIVVGLSMLIAGLLINKLRPKAWYVAGYSVVALATAATIFLALAFATCDKPDIVGFHRDTLLLLKYCNKNCRCSRDADFRPVCDDQGKFTFYTACHAGCTSVEFVNDTTYYQGCSCVEEMLGLGNTVAIEGPCKSTSCHIGWIIFQVGTILIWVLLASASVGNILIVFRSLLPQDKSLSIGFHMSWIAFAIYLPGKILYQRVIDRTCKYWGSNGVICHLYDSESLGDYLCYLSAAITLLAAIFQLLVWFFAKDLRLYDYSKSELTTDTELRDVQVSLLRLHGQEPGEAKTADTVDDPPGVNRANIGAAAANVHPAASPPSQREPQATEESLQKSSQLKFGPLGPGRTRPGHESSAIGEFPTSIQTVAETEDELDSSSDDEVDLRKPKKGTGISYRPLELDSDVESDLNSTGPRTRKRVMSKEFDPVLNIVGVASFPPPDNSQRPGSSDDEDGSVFVRERRHSRPNRSMHNVNSLSPVQERVKEFESRSDNDDGFSKTDSFEFSSKAPQKRVSGSPSKREPYRLTGDFNEVGLPIIELEKEPVSPTSPVMKIQSIQASQENFLKHLSAENLDKISPREVKIDSLDSPNDSSKSERYTLDDVVAEPDVPPLPTSPPPQSSNSSGIGSSLLSDNEEKTDDPMTSRSRENLDGKSPPTSPSGRKLPTLITDF